MRAAIIAGLLVLSPGLLTAQTDRTPAAIFRDAKSSVVLIVGGNDAGNPTVQGSGFIVAPNRIVTNHHVVAGTAVAMAVFSDGGSSPVTAVASDSPSKDLVILVATTGQRPALNLGDELTLQQGDPVYAIGAPEGLELTFTNGIVSGFRNVDEQFLIQSTAPIGHGSSGGPLFDRSGKVIGITSSMLSRTPGIYFSVGVGDLKRLLRTPLPVTLAFSEWAKDNPATDESAAEQPPLVKAGGESERIEGLLGNKKFDEARTALQTLAKSNPDDPVVHRLNGELDVRTGNVEGALRELGLAVEKSPQDSLAHFYYAIALYEAHQYKQALPEEEKSNNLAPTDADHSLLSVLYYAVRNYKQAEAMARATLTSKPQDQTALDVVYGVAYHDESKRGDWSQIASRLSSTYADDFWVHVAQGFDAVKQNQDANAIAAFKAAENSDFPDPVAFMSLQSIYIRQSQLGEANDQIKAGLEEFPDDAGLLGSGMFVSLLGRDNTEAERRFKTLERLYPDTALTNFDGCLFYYGIAQPSNGLPYCLRAAEQSPSSHTAHSNYGWAALDADQFPLAFQQFNQGYKLVADKWNTLSEKEVVDLVWGFAIADYFSGDKNQCRKLLGILRKGYPSALTITGLQGMQLLWSNKTLTRIEVILRDIKP